MRVSSSMFCARELTRIESHFPHIFMASMRIFVDNVVRTYAQTGYKSLSLRIHREHETFILQNFSFVCFKTTQQALLDILIYCFATNIKVYRKKYQEFPGSCFIRKISTIYRKTIWPVRSERNKSKKQHLYIDLSASILDQALY